MSCNPRAESFKASVPKTIWMMWLQGFDNAPNIVKACFASWKGLNPDWQIVFLDEKTVHEYVDVSWLTDKALPTQALADIVRINLLTKYGGVWVDATCYCCKPLDDWLEESARSGFFAFDRPAKSRLMDNWFMASHQGCYLTSKLCQEAKGYWLENPGLARRPKLSRFLNGLSTNTYTTRFWFSYPVRKILKIYPYMWFQYLFAELVRTDPDFRRMWQATPKVSADIPHRLLRLGLLEPLDETAKSEIDSKKSPLYKLTWKHNAEEYSEGSILGYLLHSEGTRGA